MEAMQKLISEFHHAPANKYQELYDIFVADLHSRTESPEFCLKRMDVALHSWVGSVLPSGIEHNNLERLIVNWCSRNEKLSEKTIEYELGSEKCTNLITRIISEKMTYEQVLEMMESEVCKITQQLN